MTVLRPPSSTAGVFQPTWGRGIFAFLLALAGFFLPQEIPLEWYPLNEPGTDINYLEISCASDKTGNVEISYDLGQRGHQPINTIKFPISPTAQTYTYTFPLPDAPMVEMHVSPPGQGGTLNIRQMRIINRRREEIRRFTRDLFRIGPEIAAISPWTDGWKITSTAAAIAPMSRIELYSPIIPAGKDHRNLLRCLVSTGYLSMILWVLLLAVLFTFYRPISWRDLGSHLGFMACLAICYAFVGNRGLIRNSIDYARYEIDSPIDPGLRLEFDLLSNNPTDAQLFWDTGQGISESESCRKQYESHSGIQILRFPLPNHPLHALRFDPREGEGRLEIRGIRVVDGGQRTRAVLPLDSLQPRQEITLLQAGSDSLIIETSPGGIDPITEFKPTALALINKTLAGQTAPVNLRLAR